jgi:cobalt/nickel transport system permease protein
MHLPDGFLDAKTWLTLDVVSFVLAFISFKKTGRNLEEKQIPLLGVLAAFIFAAQMINYPVIGGTSGHLVGGVLTAALLGPWAGFLILTVVLVVQALVFQDGGILALGANIFNMAFVGSFLGYYIFKWLSNIFKENLAIFLASLISMVLASIVCSFELIVSKTAAFWPTLPLMGGIHILIGIGEGLITTAIYLAVKRVRSDLIYSEKIREG